MGFFDDLKDDLSQAVNELDGLDMPKDADAAAKNDAADKKADTPISGAVADAKDNKPNNGFSGPVKTGQDTKPDAQKKETIGTANQEEKHMSENTVQSANPQSKDAPKFGEDKKTDVKDNQIATDETAVITEGMTITGDIKSSGSLDLVGNVIGNIDILGKLNATGSIQGDCKAAEIFAEGARVNGEINSKGSVKIGQSSVVIGNIFATNAVVAGAVKGDIDVKGPVILDTTAIVMGNIKSKSVQINNGAVIEGMCSQCYADVSPTTFFDDFKKKK